MEKNKKDLIKKRDRARCNTVKAILEAYRISLNLIDEYKKEIKEKQDKISYLRSSLSSLSEVKGSSMAKDDVIIRELDKISELESEIQAIKAETDQAKKAISSIDDPIAKAIVIRIWINKTDSMRSLASYFDLSSTMIWRKSDIVLLRLYKNLLF